MWVKQDVIIVEWRIWDTTRDGSYSIKRFKVNKRGVFDWGYISRSNTRGGELFGQKTNLLSRL